MLRSPEYANHICILVGHVCFEFHILVTKLSTDERLWDQNGALFLFSGEERLRSRFLHQQSSTTSRTVAAHVPPQNYCPKLIDLG